jgi:hypothetical protein
MLEFFSENGEATAFSPDDEHLYLWDGSAVAYLHDGKVYAYSGRLLGWYENGWLYDRKNRPALFKKGATGGPIKPVTSVKPVKSVKQVKPVKGVQQVAHARPVRSSSWSAASSDGYFEQ